LGKNTVSFIDRLLAIPLAIYFWWYGYRQKVGKHRKKKSINAANDNGVDNRGE